MKEREKEGDRSRVRGGCAPRNEGRGTPRRVEADEGERNEGKGSRLADNCAIRAINIYNVSIGRR